MIRALLIINELSLLSSLRRSLLRNGIWCAPCLSREDVFHMLGSIPFTAIVLDVDDPQRGSTALGRELHDAYPHVRRIALTKSTNMGADPDLRVNRVLFQPVDMSELVTAISGVRTPTLEMHAVQ